MIPQYAILSCNNNNDYLDYWPVTAQSWKERIGVEPVLCYVGEEPIEELEKHGTVIRQDPANDIDPVFQSQWARFWVAQRFPNSICIISDIDMIPLSKKHFIDQVRHLDENKYVHLNPCIKSYGHLPVCYHMALGKTFKHVLQLHDSWETSCKEVFETQKGPAGNPRGFDITYDWFTDELYAHDKVCQHADQSIFEFLDRPEGQQGRRIDRTHWIFSRRLLLDGYYIDAHCPRGYSSNKRLVDPLIRNEQLPFTYRLTFYMKAILRACVSKCMLTKD